MTGPDNKDFEDFTPAMESRTAVDDWLAGHDHRFGLFIGGAWTDAASAQGMDSHAPATGEKLATFSVADQSDVDEAIAAARSAQPVWWTRGGHGRAKYLYAIARLIQKHSRRFAVLESLDNGKPIRETRDIDIPLVIRHFYHHAGYAQLLQEKFPGFEPHGVAGQVIPWNFPLLMLAWKVAPALAAGNTVVLKPAEYTPLTALMFAEICMEAGLPAGVVNIVTGAGDTGAHVVSGAVDKVAFTGSTAVGKAIRRSVAGSGKALTLELGGKSPYIVFEDADQDGAVEGLVDAIWFNQGQVCCAGSRLLVQEGIADAFIAKVKTRLSRMRVGHSLDKTIDMSAIVDRVQLDRITAMVKEGEAQGATVWQPACSLPEDGIYYPPTLVTDALGDNILHVDEVFGPVLTVSTFRTQKEAIALANNSRYGLAASVWSETIGRALEVAPALKAGVVWVNGTNMFDAAAGFGGYRESGMGREGGTEGMHAYLKRADTAARTDWTPIPQAQTTAGTATDGAVDKTVKFYIGGKQARPDGGNSTAVCDHAGNTVGHVGAGNAKDVRNAVEAAVKAEGWGASAGHLRAQILYYLAENLNIRAEECAGTLSALTGVADDKATEEVTTAITRLFDAAAIADKLDGAIKSPPSQALAVQVNEPVGVLGIICPDEAPLLAPITLMAHAIAAGNRCVMIMGERYPSLMAEMYQLLETSDIPAGVVNMIAGDMHTLSTTLAKHMAVDGVWHVGDTASTAEIEDLATETMKRVWTNGGKTLDWLQGDALLTTSAIMDRAVEKKTIWIPYGDSM